MAKKAAKRKAAKRKKAPVTAAATGKGNPGAMPPLGGVAGLVDSLGTKKKKKTKKRSLPDVRVEAKAGDGRLWVDVAVEALSQQSKAKSLLDDAKQALQPELERQRLEICRRTGEFSSSVRVNNRLTHKTKSRYRKIPVSRAEAIMGIFGKELFQKFFSTTTKIELETDVLEANPDLAKAIIAAIQEKCEEHDVDVGDLLSTEIVLTPTEEYSRARVMNADVGRRHADAEAAGLVVPHEASLSEK